MTIRVVLGGVASVARKRDVAFHDRIAKKLGAASVAPVGRRIRGPLDLMSLRAEVQRRLRSSGGRPSDPSWDFSRQVPFRAAAWKALEEAAEAISSEERKVSPGQLAALLIERALSDIQVAE